MFDKGEKTTRVDGKGLWRSWKRNFKTKLLALFDLIDNSLDAAIQGQIGSGDHDSFVGRVHVYPDVYEVLDGPANASATTTGLCIINNCAKEIRPLEKVLEVYTSSKVHSGAGDIGENGVGLKQGCATLSDLSFVLVKNGSDANIELGICAESLQREEGCYLPAFKFSNKKGLGQEPLKEQMIDLFCQPKHADVARCIAQYGAASSGSDPNLLIGVERLCRHFDHICCNFFNNKRAFLVILDKVHHGQSEDYVQNACDAQQKITVHHLMKELGNEIPRTYLHIPNSFDFTIGDKKANFTYWPARLVELTAFTVNVNAKIPWQQKFDQTNNHPESYELRVFIGFDVMRITEPKAGKEGSLYVYSRQSGRLISHHPDARTLLSLSAGGTMFCQGLTVIIDDIGGNLPLNPTKQEVAFGEESHGAIHQENLMAWVGSVVHFFYQFHLRTFHDKKTVLTRKIANFGDVLLQKHRQLKILDNSHLTTYDLSFKSIGKSIRVDKSSAREIVGADTLYRLSAEKSRTTSAPNSGVNGRKRKATKNDDTQPSNPPKIPRRRQPIAYHEAEPASDGANEEANGNDSDSSTTQFKAEDGEVEDGEVQDGEVEKDAPTYSSASPNFRKICGELTERIITQRAQIKSLKDELAEEKDLRQGMEQQIRALQRRINTLES